MTRWLRFFILGQVLMVLSCNKHIGGISGDLQHRWQIVSLNGEAFRYVGKSQDYFDFSNGTLIEFFAGHYDTLSYTLTNNLLDIQGPNITSSIPYQITSLSDSQLIISGTNPRFPILHILDSLRR